MIPVANERGAMQPQIIFEDNHLLVVNKPAGIPTMGAEQAETVHRLAVEYLRHKYGKPGRVFLGIVSRLDRVTSGVLVLARTSKAASRLAPQFAPADASGRGATAWPGARKIYLAVVEGHPAVAAAESRGWIWKDEARHRMEVTLGSAGTGNASGTAPSGDDRLPKDARRCHLRYWTVGSWPRGTALGVELFTGRKHQIRAQLSRQGMPVWGDRKYGGRQPFPDGVALHCWGLQIEHPTRRDRLDFVAEPPDSWDIFPGGRATVRRWCQQLGGPSDTVNGSSQSSTARPPDR